MKKDIIPLILNNQELPIVYWHTATASVIILHGQRQQLVTIAKFDGVTDFSCPRTEDIWERKQLQSHEKVLYNSNGQPVASYQPVGRRLSIWHDRKTTIIHIPENTGMTYENIVR